METSVNNKCKAFTSLEQSRKLAEILPLETADMNYWCGTQIRIGGHRTMDKDLDVPCWSLAALLELLPKKIEIVDNVYKLGVYLYGIYYWNINNGNLCFESKDKDNLVDACVDMIIKLNELKML